MNSTPKEALDAYHRSRVRRRRWPRVLFWASVCVVVLHLVLVVLMSAGVAIWLNPGLSILLLPSGFLLLVGLPIVAAFLLGFLAFNGRRLTRTARVLLIVQVILLVGIRVRLHLTTDGIFCKQLQVWSFRHAGGPKLQAWAISVLNDSVKQKGLLNEPAGDFLDCLGDAGTKWASVKGGSSEAIALPS